MLGILPRKRSKGAGWDIASMAPKLKKGQRPEDEHGPPAGAVISAAAKRYKTDDRVDSGMVTAAQIAMLGELLTRKTSRGASSTSQPACVFLHWLKKVQCPVGHHHVPGPLPLI